MNVQVTVGIPAYNAAVTLRRAVESVLDQTHPDCRVHISDDASTDATGDLGQALEREHARVRYTRQPLNLNHHGNFRFLLESAETPYFMWLPGDDYLEPGYVRKMLEVLEAEPEIVSCVSRVRFVASNGTVRIAGGTYPLMGDRIANLAAYLWDPKDNSRLFGLHRTRALRQAFPASDFLIAYDWAAMAGMLLHGKQAEVDEVLMVRDETPARSYMEMIRRDGGGALARGFPLMHMTRDLLFRLKIPLSMTVIRPLIFLNMSMHFQYICTFHPGYDRVRRLMERYVLWRLRAHG